MHTLDHASIGQLVHLHSGKVRELYELGEDRLLVIATDRISAFDQVLSTAIPAKGAVLNRLAAWWFEQTADLVPNHLDRVVDPAVSLVHRCEPIRLEVIIRGYLAGSMWRRYQAGERDFGGTTLPDGLTLNARLPRPVVTPTTKEEGGDRPITPAEIVSGGWADEATWARMERTARNLFQRGTTMLARRGILLVDTKYEFGTLGGDLVLIDEIHTPDSSRFWDVESWEADPENARQIDKEFVRSWLVEHRQAGRIPSELPRKVVEETTRRYLEIYRRITGEPLDLVPEDPRQRIYANLVATGTIAPGYVVVFMGSPSDHDHCLKIRSKIHEYGIPAHLRVVSAHKNGERITAMARHYNRSIEPGAAVAVAGLSNGLGGALAANLVIPVLNCPPFTDRADLMVNLHSSVMMPSRTPAATVIRPESAALAALRSLNLPQLRDRFARDIQEMKVGLAQADAAYRRR